jgi:hypothetical protein
MHRYKAAGVSPYNSFPTAYHGPFQAYLKAFNSHGCQVKPVIKLVAAGFEVLADFAQPDLKEAH